VFSPDSTSDPFFDGSFEAFQKVPLPARHKISKGKFFHPQTFFEELKESRSLLRRSVSRNVGEKRPNCSKNKTIWRLSWMFWLSVLHYLL
jgi:hypothetical protein